LKIFVLDKNQFFFSFWHVQKKKRTALTNKNNSKMYNSVVLLLLLATAVVAQQYPPVLPAKIDASDVRPAEHVYVVTVYVGAPPEEMQLEVRFDVAGLWIYRDQSTHSAGHVEATDGTESDVVYFGGVRQRCETHRGVPSTLASPLLCRTCLGVLGLRADSSIWQWWPDASFTPASVTLGARAPALRERTAHTWELLCENSELEWALCTTRVLWNGRMYRAELAPHYPYTSMPRHVRDAYLNDKNIYDDALDWPDFELEFVDAKGEGTLGVSFSRDDLSGQHGVEARELLIDVRKDRDDTFVLGSALLRKLLLYRASDRTRLVVHAHPVFSHLPVVNSVLFLVTLWFLVRWKMTDLGKHYARSHERSTRTRALDLAYQIAGWAVAITAVFLPSTFVVLRDTVWLHGIMGAIVFVGIAVEIASRVVLRVAETRRKLQRPSALSFLIVLAESMWHEAILTTALWLFVVPRRREDLAGPLTAVAAGASLYSVVVHAVIFFVFVAVNRRRKHGVVSAVSLFNLVSVLALSTFFTVLFISLSTLPVLHRSSAIYAELATAIVALGAVLIILLGVGMADAYITRAVQISVKQHLEAQADKQERDKRQGSAVGNVVYQKWN
jgi:hypothetical protein